MKNITLSQVFLGKIKNTQFNISQKDGQRFCKPENFN